MESGPKGQDISIKRRREAPASRFVGRSFSSDINPTPRSGLPFVNRATARFSLRGGSAASKGGAFPACFRVARAHLCPSSLPAAGSKGPGTPLPREAPPLSLHL